MNNRSLWRPDVLYLVICPKITLNRPSPSTIELVLDDHLSLELTVGYVFETLGSRWHNWRQECRQGRQRKSIELRFFHYRSLRCQTGPRTDLWLNNISQNWTTFGFQESFQITEIIHRLFKSILGEFKGSLEFDGDVMTEKIQWNTLKLNFWNQKWTNKCDLMF